MRVKLGDTLYFFVRTKNASGTPTAPSAAPTYEIYSGAADSTMTSGTGTMTLIATAKYRASHAISSANGYESGKAYTITVDYTVGGVARSEELEFFVD